MQLHPPGRPAPRPRPDLHGDPNRLCGPWLLALMAALALSAQLLLAMGPGAEVATEAPESAPEPVAETPSHESPAELPRIVAIGDIHGAIDPLRAILREAGLIDPNDDGEDR